MMREIGTSALTHGWQTATDTSIQAGELGMKEVGQILSEGAKWVGASGLSALQGAMSFATHPLTLGTALAVGGTFMGSGYIQGMLSGGTVRAPADEGQQETALNRLRTMRSTDGTKVDTLAKLLDPEAEGDKPHVSTKDSRRLQDANCLQLEGSRKEYQKHLNAHLAAYATRGAHMVAKDDGALFLGMMKELTGQEPKEGQSAKEFMAGIDRNAFPSDVIERNSSWWNKSSHYQSGNAGHFEGLRQFGVQLEDGGHVLFGLAEVNGQMRSWFQLEGHGVSSWGEFAMHGRDFAVHKGSGDGQVGPLGLCPFSEKTSDTQRIGREIAFSIVKEGSY